MFVLPSFNQYTCRDYNETACLILMTDLNGFVKGDAVSVQAYDTALSAVGTGAIYKTITDPVTVKAVNVTDTSCTLVWE